MQVNKYIEYDDERREEGDIYYQLLRTLFHYSEL
jgi:hypothetical protein